MQYHFSLTLRHYYDADTLALVMAWAESAGPVCQYFQTYWLKMAGIKQLLKIAGIKQNIIFHKHFKMNFQST
jgi:hypothetical protein